MAKLTDHNNALNSQITYLKQELRDHKSKTTPPHKTPQDMSHKQQSPQNKQQSPDKAGAAQLNKQSQKWYFQWPLTSQDTRLGLPLLNKQLQQCYCQWSLTSQDTRLGLPRSRSSRNSGTTSDPWHVWESLDSKTPLTQPATPSHSNFHSTEKNQDESTNWHKDVWRAAGRIPHRGNFISTILVRSLSFQCVFYIGNSSKWPFINMLTVASKWKRKK